MTGAPPSPTRGKKSPRKTTLTLALLGLALLLSLPAAAAGNVPAGRYDLSFAGLSIEMPAGVRLLKQNEHGAAFMMLASEGGPLVVATKAGVVTRPSPDAQTRVEPVEIDGVKGWMFTKVASQGVHEATITTLVLQTQSDQGTVITATGKAWTAALASLRRL